MSAIVCGKRSFFEESSSNGSPVSKKFRFSSSTSPVRFPSSSPPPPFSSPRDTLLDRLREAFPLMDKQLLEKALEECGDDIDAAIKRLHELHLVSSEENSVPVGDLEKNEVNDATGDDTTKDTANQNTLPADGAQWVELFVREMMSATSLDDARARAAKLLEVVEKSISSRACTEAAETFQKENVMLKEQNTILKHAVVIQHERQKEYEDMARELQHLKQLVPQYQEQLRNLEVSNYTLRMHLEQAQQSSSIPGRFHPDVF
ncbi:hypothetical protein Dimus_004418 [Dionaea muscipula]